MKIAIVVPCYNEEEMLPETTRQLLGIAERLKTECLADATLLYVDDGSRDRTWELIRAHAAENPCVHGLKLAHNRGHQQALWAGLDWASEHADAAISIDADLQDDVEAILSMVREFQNGMDIVYGVRKVRTTDTWFKRVTAQGFYRFVKWLGGDILYNHADFRLMSRRATQQLLKYRERNLFLRGIVPLIGYKTAQVYYDRAPRTAGESKYPLSKMLNFAVDGITSFSIKPVRLVLCMGGIFILIALAMFIYVLYSYFSGRAVTGWASMILSIWFVGGCVLVGLGVVGEYIGKIYIEVKDRPRYNIEKIEKK